MKTFYEKSTITDKNNPINITYNKLLLKKSSEVNKWIDELREYIITQWDEAGQPPVIGQNEDEIISKWLKCYSVDTNNFFTEKNKVVRNFSKLASGVNQFFPTMLKTKISTGVSSDNATSIYDMFKEDSLREKFSKAMKRGLYKDSMYSFGKTVRREEVTDGIEKFIDEINKDKDYGLTIIKQKNKWKVDPNGEWLSFTGTLVKDLLDRNILTEDNIRTLDGEDLDDEVILKNGQTRYYHFHCRKYNRNQRIFPTALQIFRLGLGQPAVNFPPLTAKFLYEHFTEHCKDEKITVYDPSAGWGGRMLGAAASGKSYIGFEPCDETYKSLKELVSYLKLPNITLYNDVAENMNNYDFKNVDIILTSPPYFNLEIYSNKGSETKHSNYTDWVTKWLSPLVKMSTDRLNPLGWSCWNVHNIGKMKIIDDIFSIHKNLNYEQIRYFGIVSGKRQANDQTQKNLDITKIYFKKT